MKKVQSHRRKGKAAATQKYSVFICFVENAPFVTRVLASWSVAEVVGIEMVDVCTYVFASVNVLLLSDVEVVEAMEEEEEGSTVLVGALLLVLVLEA